MVDIDCCSDVIFFAKGLASGYKFDVKIVEPIVDIIAVQGPKSFDLMEKVFGKIIKELKFFGFSYFEFEGVLLYNLFLYSYHHTRLVYVA